MTEVFTLSDVKWEAEEWLTAAKVEEWDKEAFLGIVEHLKTIARPAYAIARVAVNVLNPEEVSLGSRTFKSRVMAHNLADSKVVLPYVITCGRAAHDYCVSLADPLEQYWCDGINLRLLRQAAAQARAKAKEILGGDEPSAMSPGSLEDWPITEQQGLFSLFECDIESDVGVTLTDSCLMVPFKSMSGIYFVTSGHFINCSLCQRTDCTGRRAPFDPHLAHEYGLSE